MRRNSDAIAEMTAQHRPFDDRGPVDRTSGISTARELMGFRLSDPAADVRGWSVVASDQREAGVVTGLLVDIHTRKVRYLAVALDVALERRARSRDPGTVMIPVGVVRRAEKSRAILLEGITSWMMIRAPRVPSRPITRADELATLAVYGLLEGVTDRNLYSGAQFDDSTLLSSSGTW